MPESKLQIIMPTAEDMKKLGIKKEAEQEQARVVNHEHDEGYYQATFGSTLGKAVYAIVAGRNQERVKAFENPDVQRLVEAIFKFLEKRAAEMGYFTTDLEFSPDSGISQDGKILLKLIPQMGATRKA